MQARSYCAAPCIFYFSAGEEKMDESHETQPKNTGTAVTGGS